MHRSRALEALELNPTSVVYTMYRQHSRKLIEMTSGINT